MDVVQERHKIVLTNAIANSPPLVFSHGVDECVVSDVGASEIVSHGPSHRLDLACVDTIYLDKLCQMIDYLMLVAII